MPGVFVWGTGVFPNTCYKVFVESEEGYRQPLLTYSVVDAGAMLMFDQIPGKHAEEYAGQSHNGPYTFMTTDERIALSEPLAGIRRMRREKDISMGSWVSYFGYGWADARIPEATEYNGYIRQALVTLDGIVKKQNSEVRVLWQGYKVDGEYYIDYLMQDSFWVLLLKEYFRTYDVRLQSGKEYSIVAEWDSGSEKMDIGNLPMISRNVKMELIKADDPK